jgi:hypothetical protein
MTPDEQTEYQAILDRGYWAPAGNHLHFIPQPQDAARYHILSEKHVEELSHAGERSDRC